VGLFREKAVPDSSNSVGHPAPEVVDSALLALRRACKGGKLLNEHLALRGLGGVESQDLMEAGYALMGEVDRLSADADVDGTIVEEAGYCLMAASQALLYLAELRMGTSVPGGPAVLPSGHDQEFEPQNADEAITFWSAKYEEALQAAERLLAVGGGASQV
jgi:hypothetical protein